MERARDALVLERSFGELCLVAGRDIDRVDVRPAVERERGPVRGDRRCATVNDATLGVGFGEQHCLGAIVDVDRDERPAGAPVGEADEQQTAVVEPRGRVRGGRIGRPPHEVAGVDIDDADLLRLAVGEPVGETVVTPRELCDIVVRGNPVGAAGLSVGDEQNRPVSVERCGDEPVVSRPRGRSQIFDVEDILDR